MQVYKSHIASFLLLAFLFPQVAGSMHYSFVPHTSSDNNRFGYNKPDPNLQYHSCIYHLSGFSPLLPVEQNGEASEIPEFRVAHNFCSLEHYVHQPNYNFQLRGPPFTPNLSEVKYRAFQKPNLYLKTKKHSNENQINLFIQS